MTSDVTASSDARRGALRFAARALRLRCPECGAARIFKPWRQTRTLDDWLNPLDGCPHCEYPYRREEGYFMMSICAVNYGVVTGGAIGLGLLLDAWFAPPFWVILLAVCAPMPLASFLFARHAKALFIAADHYFDPHSARRAGSTTDEHG
jgi:uncharacterized protein (DUF983 family)